MELFSEIYGCYYTVLARILQRAYETGVTRADMEAVAEESGFADTAFHLLPRLVSGEWPLLVAREGRYVSALSSADTRRPPTLLEQAWLKALLADPRMRLFLTDSQLQQLDGLLTTPPLFLPEDFHFYDAVAPGDPYEDAVYRERFRLILNATRQHTPLHIT